MILSAADLTSLIPRSATSRNAHEITAMRGVRYRHGYAPSLELAAKDIFDRANVIYPGALLLSASHELRKRARSVSHWTKGNSQCWAAVTASPPTRRRFCYR